MKDGKIQNDKNIKKILIAFDMDNTILNGNSISLSIKKLLHQDIIDNFNKSFKEQSKHKRNNLADIQQTIFKVIKEETGVSLNELEIIVKSITLNKGFKELFDFIRNNRQYVDALLITGNNSILVEWVLQRHNLKDIFPLYYTNYAEPHHEYLMKVKECHKHTCDTCDIAQCKGQLIEEHLNKFYPSKENVTVFYVGDGENDYCTGRYLRESDLLLARLGWKMHRMINDDIFKNQLEFKCEIDTWKDGFYIIDKMKSRIKKLNSLFSRF